MRRIALTWVFLSLLASGVWGQALTVTSSRVWTGKDMVKRIYLEVKVTNAGKEEADGTLELVMTPEFPASSVERPPGQEDVQDVLSPTSMSKAVTPLKPGRSLTLTFSTPFLAQDSFNTGGKDTGYFYSQLNLPNDPRASSVKFNYKLTLTQ